MGAVAAAAHAGGGMCNTAPRFSAYIKADAPKDPWYLRIDRRLRTKGRLRDRSQIVRPREKTWRDEDGGWAILEEI